MAATLRWWARTIRVDGADFTVVGVMPREFAWQFWSGPRQLWVPVGYTKTDFGRGDNSFISIARLKPGVSVAQAAAEMEAVGKTCSAQYPRDDADMGATVSPSPTTEWRACATTMLTLLAAVAFVLLIACVNVANLLLARGAVRQKEFAIRLALGAAGFRIARQLLTENVLLALAGGAAGLLLAAIEHHACCFMHSSWAIPCTCRCAGRLHSDGRPRLCLWPAGFLPDRCAVRRRAGLSALRTGMNESLKEGGRNPGAGGHNRLRQVLVASEVALALVVLSGAGLMIKSMTRLLGVDPGLNPKNVLSHGNVGSPGRDLRRAPGPAALLPGSRRARGRHSGRPVCGAVAHLPFPGKRGPGLPDRGPAASRPW
jgi:putative ABC transport system permease protein